MVLDYLKMNAPKTLINVCMCDTASSRKFYLTSLKGRGQHTVK